MLVHSLTKTTFYMTLSMLMTYHNYATVSIAMRANVCPSYYTIVDDRKRYPPEILH